MRAPVLGVEGDDGPGGGALQPGPQSPPLPSPQNVDPGMVFRAKSEHRRSYFYKLYFNLNVCQKMKNVIKLLKVWLCPC